MRKISFIQEDGGVEVTSPWGRRKGYTETRDEERDDSRRRCGPMVVPAHHRFLLASLAVSFGFLVLFLFCGNFYGIVVVQVCSRDEHP